MIYTKSLVAFYYIRLFIHLWHKITKKVPKNIQLASCYVLHLKKNSKGD